MSIGEKIRNARVHMGLTQKDLCELLKQNNNINVLDTTISNWELGKSQPDLDSIKALCKILDVDANYIFEFYEYSDEEKKSFEAFNRFLKEQYNEDENTKFINFVSENKDILTDSDKNIIRAIIEERIKNK